jgi:NAD(P)-dependent dehydrogenase (short-subunit alcohol dehydrogenase family)
MRALVTGASRGIGLGLCFVLREQRDDVLAVCRQPTPELESLGTTVLRGIDLTEPGVVDSLRVAVGELALDLVVCNAGVNLSFDADGIESTDLEAVRSELEVNVVGVARTVAALLPVIRGGGTIALVTSGAAAPGREKRGGYGYKMSKAALNMFGHVLADELRPRGISVLLVSPGPVATDLLRAVHSSGRTHFDPAEAPSPVEAARTMLGLIARASPELSGCWLDYTGTLLVDARGAQVPAPPTT